VEPVDPTITLAITPSAATVEQGGSAEVAFTATTGGGFTGTASVAVSGQPTGVSGTASGASTTGNTTTGTVTLVVGAAVATGVYSITVTASGSGVSATATFTLTVVAPPSYEIVLSGPVVGVFQDGSASVAVEIARTNFTGAVAFQIEASVPDVSVTFSPSPATGSAASMTIEAASTTPPGDYPATLRGTSSTLPDVTASFTLRVFETGGTPLALDFSACVPGGRPLWLAYQSGSGIWVQVTGVDDTYSITSAGERISLSYVVEPEAGRYAVEVEHLMISEAPTFSLCEDDPAGLKTVNGQTAQLVGNTNLSLGSATVSTFTAGAFSIEGVASGVLDFVGYSAHTSGGTDRIVIERELNVADGGSLGTIDFTADGFDAIGATMTVSGLSGGETLTAWMSYATDPGGAGACSVAPLYTGVAGSPFLARGVPPAEQEAGDAHIVRVVAAGAGHIRLGELTMASLADATVAVGPELPTPTVVNETGGAGYLRLRPDVTMPVEYDGLHRFGYSSENSSIFIRATVAALAAGGALGAPDLSAAGGWDDDWAPATGGVAQWSLSGASAVSANGRCVDGSAGITATISGTT
jgi:hypothetical protein